jgi:TPR repeat protein
VAVHDYVLDHLSALSLSLPEQAWDIIAAGLGTALEDLRTVGITAYLTHQDTPTAERLLAAAAEQGLASAMRSLGYLLHERDEVVEAERWHQAYFESR